MAILICVIICSNNYCLTTPSHHINHCCYLIRIPITHSLTIISDDKSYVFGNKFSISADFMWDLFSHFWENCLDNTRLHFLYHVLGLKNSCPECDNFAICSEPWISTNPPSETQGPFLTLIAALRNNYTHHKVWNEITYLFPKLNGVIVKVGNG